MILFLGLASGVIAACACFVEADLLGKWLGLLLAVAGIVYLAIRLYRIRRGLVESWDTLLADQPQDNKAR